jgi:hypothetical protein
VSLSDTRDGKAHASAAPPSRKPGVAALPNVDTPLHRQNGLIKRLLHLSRVLQGKTEEQSYALLAAPRFSHTANNKKVEGVVGSNNPFAADSKQPAPDSAEADGAEDYDTDEPVVNRGDINGQPRHVSAPMHWLTLRFVGRPKLEAEYQIGFVVKSIAFARWAMVSKNRAAHSSLC